MSKKKVKNQLTFFFIRWLLQSEKKDYLKIRHCIYNNKISLRLFYCNSNHHAQAMDIRYQQNNSSHYTNFLFLYRMNLYINYNTYYLENPLHLCNLSN